MDPLSISFAIGAIPGIFISCVDCYACVQFGRDFQRDFGTTLSKLEATEMRLTRWGDSMGIKGPDTKLQWENYDEKDIKTACIWLEEIKEFDDAIKKSERYITTKPDALQLIDTSAELDKAESSLKSLHLSMRKINDSRTEAWKPRKRDRVAWAIYKKGAFENLVENLSVLVKNLVDLFPAAQETQKQMCEAEVEAIPQNSRKLLPDLIGDDDEIFQAVLKAKLEQQGNHFSNINVGDRAMEQYGTNYGAGEKTRSTSYTNIAAGGNSITHFGGNYQGRTVFDARQT